jgi:predicted metal-dependent phosphoesterase TrpH
VSETATREAAERLRDLATEVAHMRRRQRIFNAHIGEYGDVYDELLRQAMESERHVDALVKQILEPLPSPPEAGE